MPLLRKCPVCGWMVDRDTIEVRCLICGHNLVVTPQASAYPRPVIVVILRAA